MYVTPLSPFDVQCSSPYSYPVTLSKTCTTAHCTRQRGLRALYLRGYYLSGNAPGGCKHQTTIRSLPYALLGDVLHDEGGCDPCKKIWLYMYT